MAGVETTIEPRRFTVDRFPGLTLVGEVWDPVGPDGLETEPRDELLMPARWCADQARLDPAARRLATEGYRVTSMDARGHGDSDWDPEGS